MPEPIIGIYKITSPSGRVYVGQSWNMARRFAKYRTKYNAHQPKLHNSLLKYGFHNHTVEIVKTFSSDVSQSELDRQEQICIDLCRAEGQRMMNVREAGSHGRMSEESKIKMRAASTGRRLSPEAKRKISIANTGKKRTDEVRRKIGDAQRGLKRGPNLKRNEQNRQRMLGTHPTIETRKKQSAWQIGRKCPHVVESNARRAAKGELFFQNILPGQWPMSGTKHSEETLQKMRLSHKGFRGQRHSESSKEKMRLRQRGENNAAAVLTESQVLEIRAKYKPNGVYPSTRLAREYSVTDRTIMAIVNGRIWKYLLLEQKAA